MDSEMILPRAPSGNRDYLGPCGNRDGVGVLEVVKKTLTQAHYTDKDRNIPETLASP